MICLFQMTEVLPISKFVLLHSTQRLQKLWIFPKKTTNCTLTIASELVILDVQGKKPFLRLTCLDALLFERFSIVLPT